MFFSPFGAGNEIKGIIHSQEPSELTRKLDSFGLALPHRDDFNSVGLINED